MPAFRRSAVWLAAAVLVVAGLELFLPRYLESGAERALRDRLGGRVRVRLAARPSVRMLLGRFDTVEVEGGPARFGILPVNRVELRLFDTVVDSWRLLLDGDAPSLPTRVARLEATLHITEADLADYLQAHLRGIGGIRVELAPEGFLISGDLELDGARLPLAVRGTFATAGEARGVVLGVDRLFVDGEPVPEALLPDLLRVTALEGAVLTLEDIPLDFVIADVRVLEGVLSVRLRGRPAEGENR